MWSQNVSKSREALCMQDDAKGLPPATRTVGGTSLVLFPPDYAEGGAPGVKVVQWQQPGGTEGRIVDLDTKGNLIPVVCFGAKRYTQNFIHKGAHMLVPQTGVTWTRDRTVGKQKILNPLPSHWFWLVQMWKIAYSHQDELSLPCLREQNQIPEEALKICDLCLCRNRAHGGSDKDLLSTVVTVTCPICMVCAHPTCSEEFCDWATLMIIGNDSADDSEQRQRCTGKVGVVVGQKPKYPEPLRLGVSVPAHFINQRRAGRAVSPLLQWPDLDLDLDLALVKTKSIVNWTN